jgi:hypothetical protein
MAWAHILAACAGGMWQQRADARRSQPARPIIINRSVKYCRTIADAMKTLPISVDIPENTKLRASKTSTTRLGIGPSISGSAQPARHDYRRLVKNAFFSTLNDVTRRTIGNCGTAAKH